MKNQKTKFVVLGLLSIEPQSGYDMKKLIDMSISHFWSESNGQLYPALNQLMKEKYISLEPEQKEGKRSRRVYSITESGKKALREWLTEKTEQKNSRRDELLLKLFFGASADPLSSIDHLKDRLARVEGTLSIFREIQQEVEKYSDSPHNLFWNLTLKNGIRHAETEIEWCREAIKMLSKGE